MTRNYMARSQCTIRIIYFQVHMTRRTCICRSAPVHRAIECSRRHNTTKVRTEALGFQERAYMKAIPKTLSKIYVRKAAL